MGALMAAISLNLLSSAFLAFFLWRMRAYERRLSQMEMPVVRS